MLHCAKGYGVALLRSISSVVTLTRATMLNGVGRPRRAWVVGGQCRLPSRLRVSASPAPSAESCERARDLIAQPGHGHGPPAPAPRPARVLCSPCAAVSCDSVRASAPRPPRLVCNAASRSARSKLLSNTSFSRLYVNCPGRGEAGDLHAQPTPLLKCYAPIAVDI